MESRQGVYLIQRSDYLNPADIKSQCMRAVNRMEEDRQTLEIVGKSIKAFSGDQEIESESFKALKQQLNDYSIIIEAMQIANHADIMDYKRLSSLTGSEVLDGETIFCQMENALRMKESYLANEDIYRKKMKTAEDTLLYAYYYWKAERYNSLADNSQRLYEKWREKTEKFDETAADTNHLFSDSEGIRSLIHRGLSKIASAFRNGAYIPNMDGGFRREIMNAGIRLAMGYSDKGGDQNGPYTLWQRGKDSDREYVRKLIHSYEEYADYSDEEISDLLMKLDSEGCGYVAFANIIVDEYRRKEEEFEKIFGFPLFLEDADGNVHVNYNCLIVDLYCASDNHKMVKKMWREYDIYDEDEDFSATNGWGTAPEDRIYRFERYMDRYGVKVKLENIECAPHEVYQKCREEAEKGNRLIISTCPVRLEDDEGEPAQMDGGHAMTVTGLAGDGRIEVSSWGGRYYITPDDPDYTTPEKNRSKDAYIRIQSVRF